MLLRVALIQKKAAPNDPAENLARALRFIEEAAGMGADIALFPEMWSNGYAPPFAEAFDDPFLAGHEKERECWLKNALTSDSTYVRQIAGAAKKFRIGVVATCLSKSPSAPRPQNTAILIDRTGCVILEYAKVHTCDFSLEALLSPGNEFPVCVFDHVKLGLMICYDREFPESARILMLGGAEIILVPNACAMNPARIGQLAARAFENMTGIAMANYPGTGWGQSCAFSPIVFDEHGYADPALFMAGEESEQIFMAEFDMDAIRAYRKKESWGNAYRKPKTYRALLDEHVEEPFLRKRLRSSH